MMPVEIGGRLYPHAQCSTCTYWGDYNYPDAPMCIALRSSWPRIDNNCAVYKETSWRGPAVVTPSPAAIADQLVAALDGGEVDREQA